MVFLLEQWKKHFERERPAVPEPAAAAESIEALLGESDPSGSGEEALVPDPEWEDTEQVRTPRWQRPAIFVVAGLLFLTAGGYTLANDWWVARQRQSLDQQLRRTAATVQSEAVRKGGEMQSSFDQLLAQDDKPKAILTLPPPPVPAAAKFTQTLPPVLKRLPPLPPLAPPPRALPPPPIPAAAVPAGQIGTAPAKIALVGGNEQVVLLDVGGERLQLMQGQTSPQGITVLSAMALPGRYSVRLRRSDGSPLELTMVAGTPPAADTRADVAQSAPASRPPSEPVTPLY